MAKPLVFDIETQHTFQEVNHDLRKLKISVVGTYDYGTDTYKAFREEELTELFSLMEHASVLVGFNINKFDLPVLAPYYVGTITQFPTLDILEEIQKVLGFRLALNDLAQETLAAKKSGHGLLAIEYFKAGQWDKLIHYCLDDVRITKELFDFGIKNQKLYFQDSRGRREIRVSFDQKTTQDSPISLSLPF